MTGFTDADEIGFLGTMTARAFGGNPVSDFSCFSVGFFGELFLIGIRIIFTSKEDASEDF